MITSFTVRVCGMLLTVSLVMDRGTPWGNGAIDMEISYCGTVKQSRVPLWDFRKICRIAAASTIKKSVMLTDNYYYYLVTRKLFGQWLEKYEDYNIFSDWQEYAIARSRNRRECATRQKMVSATIAPYWRDIRDHYLQYWGESYVPVVQKRFLGWYGSVPMEMLSDRIYKNWWLEKAATRNYPLAAFSWGTSISTILWKDWSDLRWTVGAMDFAEDVPWRVDSHGMDIWIARNFVCPSWWNKIFSDVRFPVSPLRMEDGTSFISRSLADAIQSSFVDLATTLPKGLPSYEEEQDVYISSGVVVAQMHGIPKDFSSEVGVLKIKVGSRISGDGVAEDYLSVEYYDRRRDSLDSIVTGDAQRLGEYETDMTSNNLVFNLKELVSRFGLNWDTVLIDGEVISKCGMWVRNCVATIVDYTDLTFFYRTPVS